MNLDHYPFTLTVLLGYTSYQIYKDIATYNEAKRNR